MRLSGLKLGTIFGIQIFIDYSWFLIFALITWILAAQYFPSIVPGLSIGTNILLGLLTAILFFVSALLHELSHSIVALKNGVCVQKITLFLFGGIAELFDEPSTPTQEFKIAIAGPLSSILLALGFWLLYLAFSAPLGNHPGVVVLLTLFQINLILALFNLLPGFPLDGGRILRSIVWKISNNLTNATKFASNAGKFIAFAIIAWGVLRFFTVDLIGGLWLVFIGLFLNQAASQSYLELLVRNALNKVKIREIMNTNLLSVSPFLSINDLLEEYFLKLDVYSLPVIYDDKIVGVVTLKDIRDFNDELSENTRVQEVMKQFSTNVVFEAEESVVDALKVMINQNLNFISVYDNGKLVGVLTLEDISKYLVEKKVI